MYYTLKDLGRDANVYVFALKLKKFVFSNEVIETGVQKLMMILEIIIQEQEFQLYQELILSQVDEIIYQSTDGTLANASETDLCIHLIKYTV